MTGPLDGVRVVDLSAVLSGPIATQIMADQGADVIKVEPLVGGDVVRQFGALRNGVGAMFAVINRNKRSIALDLKAAEGCEVLWALIANADVLIENFRPGVLERLGFGYSAVAAKNPRLVYASVSGFGPDGPYAERRVYDPVIQAVSGLTDIQSDPASGRPAFVRTVLCDKVASLTLCQAVTAALLARERTGRGEQVSVAMLDAALAFLWPEAMYNHTFLEPFDRVPEFSGGSEVFETRDGHFVVCALSDLEFAGLWRAVGQPELTEDPRLSTMRARGQNQAFLKDQIALALKRMTNAVLEEALEREDVPSARVNPRAAVLTDPQVLHRGTIRECDHPLAGRMRQPPPGAGFSSVPAAAPRPAPELGEHTDEILSACGYAPDRIEAMRRAGVVA